MSVCYSKNYKSDLPLEERLLKDVSVRLIEPSERKRHDELMEGEHYLGNANAVGQVLRYVAEYNGEWISALTFCSAALHIKPRDQFLEWSAREVAERRHLIAQNSRFLILPSTGGWPNLASRVLKLVCQRLAGDWQGHFGHRVLLVETFVDPQRFKGTCYKAAGWLALGQTKGYQRRGQDYYLDLQHPKELWVRPLERCALKLLRSKELAEDLRVGPAPPPPVPIQTNQMESFVDFLQPGLKDPRKPKGVRYPIISILAILMLSVAAGCQGPHAIARFAQSLNHGQRRRLRCRMRRGAPRQYDVPCERTIRRLLKVIDAQELTALFADWMATLDPEETQIIHLDGKVLKNANPQPARMNQDPHLSEAKALIDTPPEEQKPKANKALTLVNFQTPGQRLLDQIAVPSDTNEEAAVAAHFPKMDLTGITVIADAAHTVKANCLRLTQERGSDYLFFLKGNQPKAFAKAKQLIPENIPPSGLLDGQRTRTHHAT